MSALIQTRLGGATGKRRYRLKMRVITPLISLTDYTMFLGKVYVHGPLFVLKFGPPSRCHCTNRVHFFYGQQQRVIGGWDNAILLTTRRFLASVSTF
jgi:hypothetical protein